MQEVINRSKFAKGTIILLVGGLFCKLIGAFYRIPLSNILGPEGIGLYQLIFPIYSLFLIFISGGIPVALSKLVAECRANSEYKRAKNFLKYAFFILLISSSTVSIIFLIFNNQIANLQGNQSASIGYFGVALAIIFASVLTCFRGYFQGYQNMIPTALSQIIEQILKLIIGLVLSSVLISYGPSYGVLGALLGVAISEVFAFFYIFITYLKNKKKNRKEFDKENINFKRDFFILLKLSFPITLNSMILPFILAIDSFLIVNLLIKNGLTSSMSTQMFGVYSGMVNSLINFPTIVSLALATNLIPALSYDKEKGEKTNYLNSIFKFNFFISLPCILIYFFFSNQIMSLLYPSTTSGELLTLGSSLLKITSINIFYISMLQITTAILQAKNKSLTALVNLTLGGVVKIFLTYIFVSSSLGIYGAALGSIFCFSIASGLNLIAIKNIDFLYIKIKELLFMLINSIIMVTLAINLYFLLNFVLPEFLSILISFSISGIVFLIISIIFPIFTYDEILKIPFGNKIIQFKENHKKKNLDNL